MVGAEKLRRGAWNRLMCMALSVALASYACVPSAIAQQSADESALVAEIPFTLSEQVQDTDLNAAWAKAEGGVEKPFTISAGGTYSLSADLKSESALVIDAPGQDVLVKLNGHALTLDGTGTDTRKSMVTIAAARSVRFDGASDGGTSTIVSAGEADVRAISSTAEDCAVSANDLTVKLFNKTNTLRNLSVHVVAQSSGTLELSRCTMLMNMGDQALRSKDLLNDKSPEVPSAVYAESGVQSVVLRDCTVVGEGPQGFALADIADTTTIGNAYALYSLAASTRVEGGSFRAVSALGNATCLYATSLDVLSGATGDPVSLQANADQLATGILSTAAGSAAIHAPLEFSVDEVFAGQAQAEAALRTSVANGFVFGDCAPSGAGIAGAYPALVLTGSNLQAANADGAAIGTFADGLTSADRGALLLALGNAVPGGVCTAVSYGATVRFRMSDAEAVACINATNYYSTIEEALAAFTTGATLVLLKDAGTLSIAGAAGGTVDLNNHTVQSIDYSGSTAGAGLVVRNGTVNGTLAVSGARAGVYHHSASPLSLQDVNIAVSGSENGVYGVYAGRTAGALSLEGCSIDVSVAGYSSAGRSSGYGVNMPATAGPALALSDTSIAVHTATAGVPVYGLYSAKAATIQNCEIAVSGATGTACAAYVGGTLDAAGTVFDAYTTGAATTACDVWMRTSAPKASDISLDSCSMTVRSAAPASELAGASYVCVLGSTSDTGAVAPTGALALAGQTVLQSAGGMHVGQNVGAVSLAADFSLAGESDRSIVVGQAQQSGDAGFAVDPAVSEADLDALAGRISAKVGSYYEGRQLVPDASDAAAPVLAWRFPSAAGAAGVVRLTHDGAHTDFGTLAEALSAAQSGDTVALLADLAEPGKQAVAQDDLTIDLNGHALTLRAESAAQNAAALEYTGAGTMTVKNGTLNLRLGAALEPTAGSTYRGIAVSGGGTLVVAEDADVHADYTGSTASAAAQRAVSLTGLAVTDGSIQLAGSLGVSSAPADGAMGAMEVYGLYSAPAAGARADIAVTGSGSVNVQGRTAATTMKNTYYAEQASAQGGPSGLREISVDPETDAAFYNDICRQFRMSASYDDPNDSTARDSFASSIYYVQSMALEPEDETAWYNGLRIWAYSDEVAKQNVGKQDYIVPAHIFIAAPYDTLPQAHGVATAGDAAGAADVNVQGSVSAVCAHGNAYALDAGAAEGARISWTCRAATLSVTADAEVHPMPQGAVDLRDFIDFSSSQEKKVAYSGIANAQLVKFAPAIARDARVGEHASFTIAGACNLFAGGGDAAAVEAASFTVGGGFAPTSPTGTCTVASPTGQNKAGNTFAMRAAGARFDATLFEDAYGACKASTDASGNGVWQAAAGPTTTFKVGDAVVARYTGTAPISLVGPTAAAARADDQRQSYAPVGWSLDRDENATSGYLGPDATITPAGDAKYYAVYETGLTSVPVSFSNIFDASGALQPRVSLSATYGQTVAEALVAAGKELPAPADYTDEQTGQRFRFVGWYPYTASTPVGPLLYNQEKVGDLAVTLALNGVSAGALELRAVYVACAPGQHVVTFEVDGYTSACVVDHGQRPVYSEANNANNNYTSPSKQATETGKTFTFASWFVDADGNGQLGEGERSYALGLPPATADVDYVADWSWEWSDVTLTFYVTFVDAETGALVSGGTCIVQTTYEKNTQEIADTIAKVGSQFGYGGQVYTLDGWAVRKTDAEPLYDADNPLPSVNGDDRALSSAYARTFYGVYSTTAHKVNVTFYDGMTRLGSANVVATGTTVDAAFKATGASKPADKGAGKSFLGWATTNGATSAVDGTATQIESLVGGTDAELSLYAVFGTVPSYTVRLRNEDGSKVLYQVAVKRGNTVNAVLAAAGVKVSMPTQTGKYFSGFKTASGKHFSLDEAVTGAANVYASYADVAVKTQSKTDVSATVTPTHASLLAAALGSGISRVQFSVKPRSSADSPLRSATAKNSYTILKSYDIRLNLVDAAQKETLVTGEFGVAKLKVFVGTKYRNAKVRAFWLGSKNGNNETVLNSAVKKISKKGYITLNIGNYLVGDEDEGGNLSIAYIEGGAGSGTLEPGDDEGNEGDSGLKPGDGNSGSTDGTTDGSGDEAGNDAGTDDGASLDASDLGGTIGASSLGGSAGGGSLAGASGASGGSLASASDGAGGGSSLAESDGKSEGAALAKSENKAKLVTNASDASADGAAAESAEAAEGDGAAESGPFEGWDSNAAVLLLLAAAVLAALLRALWVFFVVKPRRREQEAEMPVMEHQYAQGIHF